MKTRNLLLTALSIGLGLIACDKAVESQSETATPETVTLSARLTSRNATDSALLSLTKQVRVILDTGTNSAKRVDSQVVDYNTGTVKLKPIRVGVAYVLTYQGLAGSQVLWTGTVRGTATTGTNAPILKLDSTVAATLKLKAPTIQFEGTGAATTVKIVSNNDAALPTQLYYRSHSKVDWTLYPTDGFKPEKLDTIWAKDSLPKVGCSDPTDKTFKAPDSVTPTPIDTPNTDTGKKDIILTLKGLVVTPGTLSPKFDSSVFRYEVIVEDTIQSVSVTATQGDSLQSIKVAGESPIQSGKAKTVAVQTDDSIFIEVTNQGKQAQYVVEVKHKQRPPALVPNYATFTLASRNGEGKPYYRLSPDSAWTKFVGVVTLDRSRTVYVIDSLDDLTSRIDSVPVNITAKPDTTKAPTITLNGSTTTINFTGWATLTLTSNSDKGGTLSYTIDSVAGKTATWIELKDRAIFYSSGTVYAKEFVQKAAFVVSSKAFTVTPYTIPPPTINIDSSMPGPIKLTLKSNAVGAIAGQTSLWYTHDSANGTSWLRHDKDTTLLIRSSTPFWVKDSSDKQISGITKVQLTVKELKVPSITVTSNDSIFGLGTGLTDLGEAQVTIKAVCSENGTVARYLLPDASWTPGTPKTVTLNQTLKKTSTIYFKCSLESDFSYSSENVRRTFTLLQPPYFEKVDSSFSGSMTANIFVDPQDAAGPTTKNVKIKYCLSAANANDCKVYQDYQETGVKIDSTLKLWAVVFSTIEPSKFSASATRVFTKNSSGVLKPNPLINGDTLKFTTNAPDSATVMKLYGAKSFSEDSTPLRVTKSTTTTLTAAGGALKLDVSWGIVSSWAANAGILVALDETWQKYDFSNVKSITFSFKTDAKTGLEFAFNSPNYLGDAAGNGIKMIKDYKPTSTFIQKVVMIPEDLAYADWMIKQADPTGTQGGGETSITWEDVKTSISNLEFRPKPVYNATGTDITPSNITLEIKDISLQLKDGTSISLAKIP